MKNIVRVLLFVVARTGLLFAIAGWLVSPWWMVSVQTQIQTSQIQIRVSDAGWSVLHGRLPPGADGEITAYVTPITRPSESWRFGEDRSAPWTWYRSYEMIPGAFYSEMKGKQSVSFAVRHWLLLFCCCSYYLALKCLFRKKDGRKETATNRPDQARGD